MTYPKAIVISAALLATAIAFASHQPAKAIFEDAKYMIAGGSEAWVLNTKTGVARMCAQGTCFKVDMR